MKGYHCDIITEVKLTKLLCESIPSNQGYEFRKKIGTSSYEKVSDSFELAEDIFSIIYFVTNFIP